MRLIPIVLCLLLVSACGGHESEAVSGDARTEQVGRDAAAGASEHAHTNRLVHEKSPYLLQHAHNPVNWYPWGPEALERAVAEDKPIFLSIGYSTCHWCHVMERESFENDEIAAILNEHYVAIKVDREERPDLDHLYMNAVQAMTGRGGWPLTVVLTPDLKPFFGGTYFPPDNFRGRPGLKTTLLNLNRGWAENREEVLDRGSKVVEYLARQTPGGAGEDAVSDLNEDLLDRAFAAVQPSYDAARGGFGDAPKFPTPHKLSFLLRYAHRTGNADALAMVRGSLDAMAAGGIHDHLGGGFHRYSTDAQWLVPHFEKMLYDQAGLALAYTDAWRVTREPGYRAVAQGILDYVIRDLGHPDGGFYAAEDADSEGEEGVFYLWAPGEIDSLLGSEDGPVFREAYRVTEAADLEGKSILNLAGFDPEVHQRFAADRERLRLARERRERPHRDEKIIVAWNGYMIEAMARAGATFDEPRYVEAAEKAASFIEQRLWKGDRLLRHYRDGAADVPAFLDDYAYLGRGLLALYEATHNPRWLRSSTKVANDLHRLFARESGGYTFNGKDGETLLTPVVEIYDGAMPSGNAVAAGFLSRLGHLTADSDLEDRGWRVMQTFAETLTRDPVNFLEMLAAADFAFGPKSEIVIAGDPADPAIIAMRQAVWTRYLPNTVTALNPVSGAEGIVALIPYLEDQTALDGKATGYVCRDYACRFPVHDVEALVRELDAR